MLCCLRYHEPPPRVSGAHCCLAGLTQQTRYVSASEDTILRAFQVLDTESKGFLTEEELLKYMCEEGRLLNQLWCHRRLNRAPPERPHGGDETSNIRPIAKLIRHAPVFCFGS